MPKNAPSTSDETAAKSSGRKRPTRRKRKPAQEERVGYLIEVKEWDYYYSLRAGDPKSRLDHEAYNELVTLRFAGPLVRPEKSRYTRADITLSAHSGMLGKPVGSALFTIGSLTSSGESLSGYIFIPAERMPELTAVAQSGRVQIVHLAGTKLRYRSGRIYSLSLDTQFDEEEW